MRKLPVYPELLKWREAVTLDGLTYHLEFEWSVRSNRWYFSLLDEDEEYLQRGTKVVTEWPLLHINTEDMPSGQIICIRKDEFDHDPTRDELGSEAFLAYFSEDEIPEEQSGYDLIIRETS